MGGLLRGLLRVAVFATLAAIYVVAGAAALVVGLWPLWVSLAAIKILFFQ